MVERWKWQRQTVGVFRSSNVSSATVCDWRWLVLSKPVFSSVIRFEITHVSTVTVWTFLSLVCPFLAMRPYWSGLRREGHSGWGALRIWTWLNKLHLVCSDQAARGQKPHGRIGWWPHTQTPGSREQGWGRISTYGVRKPMKIGLFNSATQFSTQAVLNQILPTWKRSELFCNLLSPMFGF